MTASARAHAALVRAHAALVRARARVHGSGTWTGKNLILDETLVARRPTKPIPSQRARASSVGKTPSFSFCQVDMYAS